MSTCYTPFGYLIVSREEVQATMDRIETALREAAIIVGDHDPEAIYGKAERVFRPGPATGLTTETCELGDGKTIRSINGIALRGPRYINHGPFIVTPDFDCPQCKQQISQDTDAASDMQERFFNRFQAFFEGDPKRDVACLSCGQASDANDWFTPHDFVLSDLAVEFWEWPDAAMAQAVKVMDRAVGVPASAGGGSKV